MNYRQAEAEIAKGEEVAEPIIARMRDLPRWPEIRGDALVPMGYGPDWGGRECFGTKSPKKGLKIYLSYSVVTDSEIARSILEQAMPGIDAYFSGLVMGDIVVNVDGRKKRLSLKVAFWHVLLRGKTI